MKMKLLLFLILFIFNLYTHTNAQTLSSYSLSLNTRVNINGHPHFKLDHYAGSTNSNYNKGTFIPDAETNTAVKKYTFSSSCSITTSTNFITSGYLSPAPTSTEFSTGSLSFIDTNVALIIPYGVTVTVTGGTSGVLPAVIIKGKLIIDPNESITLRVMKVIIMPGGTFESSPSSSSIHTLRIGTVIGNTNKASWDPLFTNSLICLGGTFTIQGSIDTPAWFGSNSSYITPNLSYGGKFLRDSTFTDYEPVSKMVGSVSSNTLTYTINRSFTTLVNYGSSVIDNAADFSGAGYVIARTSRNVVFQSLYKSSFMFTGNSSVNIKNALFTDMGHTSTDAFSETVLDSSNTVTSTGTNPSDRYPITLLHNTVAVNIENNIFHPFSVQITEFPPPRSIIGAKRSFGTIKNNAFILLSGSSGISLLHGTEQFDISYNGFLSTYTDTTAINTTTSFRSYPDINYINSGIITTSPYSTYNNNAFEGNFKGGAIQIIPIQNRATTFGFTSETLIGSYSTLTQENTDYKTNNLWNSVVFTNNFFAGETEIRVQYLPTIQPPLTIKFLGGWFINHKASTTLTPNIANVELIFDSSIIQGTLNKDDLYTGLSYSYLISKSLTGIYNSVTLKNVFSPATYQFFTSTFKSKYLSVVDSIFSHSVASTSEVFLNQFSNQLYFERMNSTKLFSSAVNKFSPFYGFSTSLTETAAIPNFDNTWGFGQSVKLSTNSILSTVTGVNNPPYDKYVTPVTQTVGSLSSGQYQVFASSNGNNGANPGGSHYATTIKVNTGSLNFYLGLDLTPDTAGTTRALSIFGNSWTKCGWVSNVCSTTGKKTKDTTTPTTINGISGDVVTGADELSMLSTYLVNDISTSTPSVVSVILPASTMYRFYIYTYNSIHTGANFVNPLPRYSIKINGKYQDPFTQTVVQYQKYQKIGPFYWNNDLTTSQTLTIEWATDNIKFEIPISGIEIYSSSSTAYTIPVGTTSSTKNSTTSEEIDSETDHSSASSQKIRKHYAFIILSLLVFFIIQI